MGFGIKSCSANAFSGPQKSIRVVIFSQNRPIITSGQPLCKLVFSSLSCVGPETHGNVKVYANQRSSLRPHGRGGPAYWKYGLHRFGTNALTTDVKQMGSEAPVKVVRPKRIAFSIIN